MKVVLEPREADVLAFHVMPPYYFDPNMIDHDAWTQLLNEVLLRNSGVQKKAGVVFWVVHDISYRAEEAFKKKRDA